MRTDEPTAKGDRTRQRIRAAALRSFRENGYDATTIRKVAAEVGVSVGVTNYHFPSKNHLVQELYLDVQEAHRAAAAPLLAAERGLVDRLRVVFTTGLDQLEPYHLHAGEFLSAAVSPRSPVNPLAPESADSLAIVQGLFGQALDGASASAVSDDIRALLPRALVLAHLLLALFWVYDTSEGRRRTRRLVDRGLKVLATALPLTRVPGIRRGVKDLLALATEVRPR